MNRASPTNKAIVQNWEIVQFIKQKITAFLKTQYGKCIIDTSKKICTRTLFEVDLIVYQFI